MRTVPEDDHREVGHEAAHVGDPLDRHGRGQAVRVPPLRQGFPLEAQVRGARQQPHGHEALGVSHMLPRVHQVRQPQSSRHASSQATAASEGLEEIRS